jgi:hypothetical protein
MLDRERVELVLGDQSPLVRLLEEGEQRCFNDGCQASSLLWIVFRAAARRRSNRSMRPLLRTMRSAPVKAGWQFEQTSMTIALRVERVVNVLPHEEQRTVVCNSSG